MKALPWFQLFAATVIASTIAYCSPSCEPVVKAQEALSRDALAIAQVAVSEAGFRDTDDIDGIFAVVDRRATRSRLSLARAARIQSPRPFARRRCSEERPHTRADPCRSSRRWIAYLRLDAERPRHWPRRLVWPRARFAEMLQRAQALIDGRATPQCLETPYQWGGPHVDRHRIRDGIRRGVWRVTDCGNTANVFLAPILRRAR